MLLAIAWASAEDIMTAISCVRKQSVWAFAGNAVFFKTIAQRKARRTGTLHNDRRTMSYGK